MFQEQSLGWQPRFGFSYLPFGTGSKTTIRGGFGLFNDYFPAQIMGDLISNVPNVNRFTVLGAAYGNPITMDPSAPIADTRSQPRQIKRFRRSTRRADTTVFRMEPGKSHVQIR